MPWVVMIQVVVVKDTTSDCGDDNTSNSDGGVVKVVMVVVVVMHRSRNPVGLRKYVVVCCGQSECKNYFTFYNTFLSKWRC